MSRNHWLVKSDPEEYSAHDLAADGQARWTGVANALARRHLAAMAAGDPVLIYHTGGRKEVVALGRVQTPLDPHAPPGAEQGEILLKFDQYLAAPVSLAQIKSDPAFADFALVRIGRLSVMPVTRAQWDRILSYSEAGGTGPALRRPTSVSKPPSNTVSRAAAKKATPRSSAARKSSERSPRSAKPTRATKKAATRK